MSDGGLIKRLSIEQRKRVVATILGRVEREWLQPGKITRSEYEDFRKVVLASIGNWHDFMLDVIKVSDEDMMRNDAALDLLQRVHQGQRQLSDQVAGLSADL